MWKRVKSDAALSVFIALLLVLVVMVLRSVSVSGSDLEVEAINAETSATELFVMADELAGTPCSWYASSRTVVMYAEVLLENNKESPSAAALAEAFRQVAEEAEYACLIDT